MPTPNSQPVPPWAGVAMILLTLAGWTSIPLFLRYFVKDIDAWTANGWRYGFSALMWLPVLLMHAFRGSTPDGLWRAAFWPSVFNIAAQVCFGLAPYYISPGLMTFGLRLQIVFLTIGAMLMFPGERRVVRSPYFLAGLVLLLAGTSATIAFKEGGFGDRASALGVSLSVASGLLYAAYSLAVRRSMHHLPAFTAFAAVSQYTGVGLLLLMFAFGDRMGGGAIDLSPFKFGLLLLSAIIGIGLGHTLYYAAIQRLGLVVATGVVQLQPVTVSLAALFIFGDVMRPIQWATGAAAITGAILMLIAQQRAASVPAPPAPVEANGP